jgi:hypothetical protein
MSLVVKWCFKFCHLHLFKIEKKIEISISFDNLMDEESIVAFELTFLAFKIKK